MAGSGSNSPSSLVAAEQRAGEFLAQSQWRKARDELKPLVKVDRPRFLPLLIKANIGLSREMMAKGQVAEAQQVLSYLAGIATAEQLRTAEMELPWEPGPASGDGTQLARDLADPKATWTEGEKQGMADKLVLRFQPLAGEGEGGGQVAAELRAIHEGLLALSLQQWDRLPEILRPVPHRSAFAHWSGFVKGMAAFHTGAWDKAIRFLENLPAHTVPAKASQAYLLWMRRGPAAKNQPIPSAWLEGVCRLLGHTGLGHLLLKADQLWKQGRHVESYRVFRDNVHLFPARNLEWLGTLTDFYFNGAYTLSESGFTDYTDYFDNLLTTHSTKNGVEEMLAFRTLALTSGEPIHWEGFLRVHQQICPANPRFASLVYERLGKDLSGQKGDPDRFARAPDPVDASKAVAFFTKAIELNRNNLEAHLALTALLTLLRRFSARNRLLDRMVQAFPDETRVFIDAGVACLDREAYVKGLDYLERARHLDQLNPRTPALIIQARCRLAQQYFRQKRPDKAREVSAASEPFLTDKPEDFDRSRWTVRLRQGLMEEAWGDRVQGEKLLREARSASPFPAAFLLFACLAFRSQEIRAAVPGKFWAELTLLGRSRHEVRELVFLVRIIDHLRKEAGTRQIDSAETLVRNCLQAASAKPFAREEAGQMIELRLASPAWKSGLCGVIKTVLRTDPLDPLFRFYELHLQGELKRRSEKTLRQLNTLFQEAGRRGDEATAQRIQHSIKRLEKMRPPPFPFPNPFRDEDLEDDDFDEDDFEDEDAEDEDAEDEDAEDEDAKAGMPGMADLAPHLPPALASEIEKTLALLASIPDSEIELARQHRPKEMPVEIFDILFQISRYPDRPPLPPLPTRKPKSSSTGAVPPPADNDAPDPSQLNLF